MTEAEIKAREAEMRQSHPGSFTHPALNKGEMCVGEFVPEDAPEMLVWSLQVNGQQARLGPPEFDRGVGMRALFVNTRDLILAEASRSSGAEHGK